ncbi:sensor histidine kinase [Beggiatoa sp. PS]|nr:sensor histidine kinase [Beggiatoa sp. PS]
MRSRLAIFDAGYQLVIGHRADLPRDSLRPLQQDGKVIGWIGVSRHHQIEDHLAQAFQNQQAYNYIVIAVLALLISGLAAWLLVTQLLAPVRRITVGAHSLSKGEYQTRIKVDSRDELGKLAEDFNHLAHSLERNEQVRRQWIADISHELRTPLAVLRGEIEAMQDGVRDFTPQNLKSLHGETLGLAKLVDDLYDLALSDIGALDYRREPVNVVDILHDSTNAFNPRFAVKISN